MKTNEEKINVVVNNKATNSDAVISIPDAYLILENLAEAVLVLSCKQEVVFSNLHYEQLPILLRHKLQQESLDYWKTNSPTYIMGYRIKSFKIDSGFTFIIESPIHSASHSSFNLRRIAKLMKNNNDVYQATAIAIQESIGWRWVAITRFISQEKLETLAFLDRQSKQEDIIYDISGTPCKSVIDTEQFTIFDNVVDAFPNYQTLKDLGAKNYAGLVFKGTDGQPLGHIMVMHDSEEVDFAAAEHIIEMATLTLSAHFQLCCANEAIEEVTLLANQDKLTSLGNRLAFDTAISAMAPDHHRRNTDDKTIAMIDLDGLKPINDTLGHKAGDEFIRLMGEELALLGRKSDDAYRIGGDEFAVVFSQNASPFITSLRDRLSHSLVKVSSILDFPVDASIGFASLSETSGDVYQCIQLADERMYEHKQSKKNNN
jgi:diguanylate cyclase (GGDEF)-like protein